MPTLLLDCDGVLADTEMYGHLPAFNAAFSEAGIDATWNLDEYVDLVRIGGGKERLAHYFTQHPELVGERSVDDLVVAMHRAKTNNYIQIIESGSIPGRPGIRRLVDEVKSLGWTVAMASTSALESVETVVSAVLTPGSVDAIYAGDIVKAKKPAPDIYLKAMEGMGADPACTIVIEDSEAGATAAHNAGLRHLVTHSALSSHERFPFASLIVSDLGESDAPAEVRGGEEGVLRNGMVTAATLRDILAKPL